MPDEHPSTPEKELLKFIEEKKAPAAMKVRSSFRLGKTFFSIAGLRARWSFSVTKFRGVSFKNFLVDIKTFNAVLFIGVVLLAVGFVFDFVNSLLGMDNAVEQAFAVEQDAVNFKFGDLTTLKNSAVYLEKARKRDIFKIVEDAPVVAAAQKVVEKPKEILVKTRDLKLVGISWSKDPDAMIEDTKLKRTFFVKRGSYINDVKVEAIFRDKVIVSFQGEQAELK